MPVVANAILFCIDVTRSTGKRQARGGMELKWLEDFVMLANMTSFSRAAEGAACHATGFQPSNQAA